MTGFLLVVGCGYGALCLLAFLLQNRLLYYPTQGIVWTPAAAGLEFSDVEVETEKGELVHGWHLPCEGALATVVFCHGNAGNISDRGETLRILHALELEVLIFDYPGYGRSTGSPSEASTLRAARAFVRHARESLGARRLVLWGRSLGGGVAAGVARETAPDALVLESTATSVPDRAAELFPYLPVRLLCRARYDTESSVAELDCPILIVHGQNDEVIPFAHGERIHAAAGDPKEMVTLSGDHNSGFLAAGEGYTRPVGEFLRRWLSR